MNPSHTVSCSPFAHAVITRNALARLNAEDVQKAPQRHLDQKCDPVSSKATTESVPGFRLLLAQRDRHGEKFWIIIEPNHQATTVLLPEEYDVLPRRWS